MRRLATLALVAGAVFAPAPAGAFDGNRALPGCVNEDGSGGPLPCVWDARHMGDGHGDSFIIRRDETTRYITHWWAHLLLAD